MGIPDERILLAICFALFFVIVFLLQAIQSDNCGDMIRGFWTASEQFKEDANIDQLVMYFSKGEGYDYKGYLILTVDGDTVYNDKMQFRITPKGYFKGTDYSFQMSQDTGYMPTTLTMVLDPCSGGMTLKCMKSKQIYAHFFKDNQFSARTVLEVGEADDVDDSDDVESTGCVVDAESA
jgi:hypothetical protein